MKAPLPTPVYRIMHVDNLETCLRRGSLFAPNHTPDDNLRYRVIHNAEIQDVRRQRRIPCGPGGIIHDYVSFYFGFLSPMLYQLQTGWVPGYTGGQRPIIYLVSTVQSVADSGAAFVFSDGHGIAAYTEWFDSLSHLDRVDWGMVKQKYWADTVNDPDRQRRKQAEFLVHRSCDWSLIQEIGVIDDMMKAQVNRIFELFDSDMRRPVEVRRAWYYNT